MGTISFLLVLCTVAAVTLPLSAQDYGEITGSFTDPSGAVVVGVTITVTNMGANAVREVQTNSTGNYALPFLVPGIYKVRAEHRGSKVGTRAVARLRSQGGSHDAN